MKESTSKISYLDSHSIQSVSKHLVINDTTQGIREKIQAKILSYIFNIKHGVVYSFSFTHDLFSERVGLEVLMKKGYIDTYGEGVVYSDYPRFNFFGIVLFIEQKKSTIRSWGYSFPFEEKGLAIKKALWEGIERQASYYIKNVTTLPHKTLQKGDARFLYEYIPKFTKGQITRNQQLLAHKEQLSSLSGFKISPLTGGPARFLPASLFYWGESISPTECSIKEPNTSGSGGGYTKETATLSALYELIERDAFLLFWYSRVMPSIIDIEGKGGVFFDYVRDARERFNLEIYFLDTTYDIDVPSCVCLIIDPVLHLVALGAKVSPSAETSMRGAMLEALATLSTIRSRKNYVEEEELQVYLKQSLFGDKAVDNGKRVNLYCSPMGVTLIKKLWIGDGTKKITFDSYNSNSQIFKTAREELISLQNKFKTLVKEKGEGYHIYPHQFHSTWASMTKYILMHVYVPSFLTLHLQEEYAAPLSTRLFEFAASYGITIQDESDCNPLPHPFP